MVDTMDGALAVLPRGARLVVNADYADTLTLDKAGSLEIKAGVAVSAIEVKDTAEGVVTVINNGTVSGMTGSAGKAVLDSGSGTYSRVTCTGGSAGSLLMRESDGKFCFYRKTDGTWLRPEEADESIITDVSVAYAPLSALQVTGDGLTGGDGSYELTANKGDSVTLTADALDLTGSKSTAATYRWYYESDPDTLLSTESTLTLENLRAGKRTVICMASAEGYSLTATLALTVSGEKDSQSLVLKLSKSTVGIREKIFSLLSVENVQEEAAVTYYQMLGETPEPKTDTRIDGDFAFTSTGEYQIYAYTAETDNYGATASDPIDITVTPHANHCYCGGTLEHTHEEAEWQAWDGKSEIKYSGIYLPRGNGLLRWDAAYVYLTGDIKANLTVGSRQILYLCLNGYSFTCADTSKPAITVSCGDKSFAAKLNLCDCGGTGTLGGCTGGSGGSIHAVSYSEVNLYGGTLTGNTLSGNGGAVFVEDSTFTMYGGTITGNSAANGGGIYGSSSGSNISINGGVISGNQARYGGGIYTRANSNVNGGVISGNTATEEGGGVYCKSISQSSNERSDFNGGVISGNTAKRGGGIYAGSTYVGSRSCRISGNTATEAGAGIYVDSWRLYLGGVHKKNYSFSPYIYDNTVAGAQQNLYMANADGQVALTDTVNFGENPKVGVYFTGITSEGASVMMGFSNGAVAESYRQKVFVCENPDYSQLEVRKDTYYYDLYLLNTIPKSTVTFDPNGGTLKEGEDTGTVRYGDPYGTLPVPKRVGWRFDGWFTEKNGGTKVEETTAVPTRENHTIYAHWTFIHEHCFCGGDVVSGSRTEHTDAVFTAWNGTGAISYTEKTAYVYLSQNATITSNLEVNGTTLYLCLSGHTLSSNGSNKIVVKNGGRLVLCDCAGGGTIKGATKGWGGTGIYLYNSTLDLFGGKITGGKVSGNGGGAIALDDGNCALNIYGGEISGNNGNKYGGAVYLIDGGSVTMSGGTISGNTATLYGGAFFLKNGGSVTMSGGTISGNTVTSGGASGGAFYLLKGGTITISGGEISGNTAKNGGVICAVSGGSVNLTGGVISGNKATSGNGGVINMSGGTINISGATLDGNTATQYGGAVYLYNGVTATMTDGTISHNTALKEGGGVHVYGTSTFNLKGGSITGNFSVDGGAIYLNREPSVLNMTGGEISGNTASGNGGGVYIYRSGSILNLQGGTIKENTALGSGGGIYINPGNNGQLKVSGSPVVKDNMVYGKANNVYLPNGKTITVETGKSLTGSASVGITAQTPDTEPTVVKGTAVTTGFFSDNTLYRLTDNGSNGVKIAGLLEGTGSVAMDGWTYGSASGEPRVESITNGTDKVTYQYKEKGAEDSTYTSEKPTRAGEYTVKATFAAKGDYKEAIATADFTIAVKMLTASLAAKDKTYDGSIDAVSSVSSLDGVVGSDDVRAVVISAVFDDENVGERTVTAGISLEGTDAGNYGVNATAGASAAITPAPVTITGVTVAPGRTYDGSTDAVITGCGTPTGVISGDIVTVKAGRASYSDKNVDTDKTVTFTGFTLEGEDAGNYELSAQPECTTAAITKRPLTIENLKVADKLYDGTDSAAIEGTPTLRNVVGTEDVSLVKGTPSFDSVDAGENIAVRFTEFTLAGNDIGNYTLIQPEGITASITAYKVNGSEYRVNSNDWLKEDFVVTAAEGWQLSLTNTAEGDWTNTLTVSEENNSGTLVFYLRNETSGVISERVTESYKIDKTAPTGEVHIDERQAWQDFLNKISFNLFYRNEQTVTITADDGGSGIKDIAYFVTAEDLAIEQLADKTFTSYDGAFGIEPDKELIVYARITDAAGNVTFLRSDGIVLDGTAPVISGGDNGRTYCGAVTLIITDEYLDSVTLNGEPVVLTEGRLILEPGAGEQTVTATDKAGNTTTLTVTVNDGHTWSDWTSNGDGTHSRSCRYDETHTETESCRGGGATCRDKALCEVCKAAYGEPAPRNHTNLQHFPEKAAAVTAEGNIEYWYCDGCGRYFKNAEGTQEIRKEETVIARLKDTSGTPKTGDNSQPVLWLVLMSIGGCGIIGIALAGRRKKERREGKG